MPEDNGYSNTIWIDTPDKAQESGVRHIEISVSRERRTLQSLINRAELGAIASPEDEAKAQQLVDKLFPPFPADRVRRRR